MAATKPIPKKNYEYLTESQHCYESTISQQKFETDISLSTSGAKYHTFIAIKRANRLLHRNLDAEMLQPRKKSETFSKFKRKNFNSNSIASN